MELLSTIDTSDLESASQIIKPSIPVDDRLHVDEYKHYVATAFAQLGIKSKFLPLADYVVDNLLEPNKIQTKLQGFFEQYGFTVFVVGSVEDRLFVFVGEYRQCVFLSLGRPLGKLELLLPLKLVVSIDNLNSYVSKGNVQQEFVELADSPRVVLCGLYLKEMFPLPRFALGISDIARALRRNIVRNVKLIDMQLDLSVEEVLEGLCQFQPTTIGISVTFGQQQILTEMMEKISIIFQGNMPLIVLGGSLCALNKQELLEKYPGILIATGSGEQTMIDVVNYQRGLLNKDEIHGVAYKRNEQIVEQGARSNRMGGDITPDLDLLGDTLDKNGVMQLESSRGCSYACSFCPRDHKGIWAGDAAQSISDILPYINHEYEKRPHLERKIFLVDEEFFGYNPQSESRVMDLARSLDEYNFKFETSSRIDQVYRLNRSKEWHVNRLKTWKYLSTTSMDRCLFGVESGVDTILKRFNKKSTSLQNIIALRLLTAIGVKVRCTYITFDNLMTVDELVKTYKFLGRTDVILKPIPTISEENLFDSVQSKKFVAEHTSNMPLYNEVSYLLVSMEPLKGSKYAEMLRDENLITGNNMTMGRYSADYATPAIGLFSHHCQMWIDRNFPLDYTLKSIQKYNNTSVRDHIHLLRGVIKRFSYELLGQMLFLETDNKTLLPASLASAQLSRISNMKAEWLPNSEANDKNTQILAQLMDDHLSELVAQFLERFRKVEKLISKKDSGIIRKQIDRWINKEQWGLYYV